ncbi:MAG: superoxide dismutase [Sphingomonadaceae bacterium]
MAFALPKLPFAPDALAPYISAETLSFHHGKHHKAYVDKTNELAAKAGHDDKGLVELIQAAGSGPLFNNAAQIWNHSFYWLGLSPETKTPTGALAERIIADFGSTEALIEKLAAELVAHFASGWAWLVLEGEAIKVTSYHDADTPIAHGEAPLFTLDVWEHAYYVDYRNARPKYVESVLTNCIDWDFVALNLDGQGASRADQPAGGVSGGS